MLYITCHNKSVVHGICAILAYLERRAEGWTVVAEPAGLTEIERLDEIPGPTPAM